MDAMTYARAVEIEVSDHALWRAAERFPRFLTETIEDEVRAALAAGRVTTERGPLGLAPTSDPESLYLWTEDGERIYAIRVDRGNDGRWVVTTTMRRKR